MDMEMKFSYKVSYERVEEIIKQAIDKADDLLDNPPVRIGVESLEPDGYKVRINVWVKAHGFTDVRLAFQQRLIDEFRNSDVKLPGT
jgi:small conductance mechanosensitive channel